jgi:hypothetical protein
MLAHDGHLVVREFAGLEQDNAANGQLADVMQIRPTGDGFDLFFGQTHFSRNGDGESGNASGVVLIGDGVRLIDEIIESRQLALLRFAARVCNQREQEDKRKAIVGTSIGERSRFH